VDSFALLLFHDKIPPPAAAPEVKVKEFHFLEWKKVEDLPTKLVREYFPDLAISESDFLRAYVPTPDDMHGLWKDGWLQYMFFFCCIFFYYYLFIYLFTYLFTYLFCLFIYLKSASSKCYVMNDKRKM
jgi:hypothetical protein